MGAANLFITLYVFSGYIAAFAIVLLSVLSLIDISTFMATEIAQNIALSQNPNLFNKDGIDFQTLLYSKNKAENEPYTIFLQQKIVITLYYIVATVIALMVLDLCVASLIYGFAYFGGNLETEMSIGFTYFKEDDYKVLRAFASLLLMLVFAIVYGVYYKGTFINTIQPDIIDSSANIKTITTMIYDNLSTNEAFLKSIQDDDIEASYKIINSQGNRPETIGSMIFTLALFNYYKINTVTSIEKIKKIFSKSQIRLRTVIPVEYMYYNQNPFIPNIYPSIEKKLDRLLNTETKKQAVRKNVSTRINNVNRLLTSLFKMKSTRSSVRVYMFVCFIISIVFLLLLLLIYPDIARRIKDFLLYTIIKNSDNI
jgi:hypothetical protein